LRNAAVAIVLPLTAVAASSDVLTLDRAIELAIEHNRSLQNSGHEIEKAQDRVNATRTRQYPNMNLYVLGSQQLTSFNFTLEKGVLGNYPGTGPLPAEDVHLSTGLNPTGFMMGRVSQPISTLLRIRRNLDALKTGVEIAKEQTRGEQQKI